MADPNAPPRALDQAALADRLERAVQEQIALHDSLLSLLSRKRDAVASADAEAIGRLCREERELLDRHRALEEKRDLAARSLSAAIDPTRREPLPLRDLAAHVGGERGQRLAALRDRAHAGVHEMKRVSAILASAAATLSGHVAGVMHVVQSALGRSRVYERHGRIACGVPVRSTVDLTS